MQWFQTARVKQLSVSGTSNRIEERCLTLKFNYLLKLHREGRGAERRNEKDNTFGFGEYASSIKKVTKRKLNENCKTFDWRIKFQVTLSNDIKTLV